MGHPAVEDVRLRRPALERPQRRFDLRQHPTVDHAGAHQALGLLPGERAHQRAVRAEDSLHVGEVDQLLGAQRRGHLARDQVRIDVVGRAVAPHADRRDHGDEPVVLEETDGLRVDLLDLADEADVHLLAAREPVAAPPCAEEAGVLPRQADGLAAVVVDEPDDLLVDLADEDHLDDLDRLGVGDAHAPDEARLLAEPLHQRADLGPAPVHDDRLKAHEAQEDHVEREGLIEVGALHRGAAVLDDDRLAAKLPDVRERLEQDLRALRVGHRLVSPGPRERRAVTGCTSTGPGPA